MLSKDYILGFVEGEGCFNIGVMLYTDAKPRKGTKRNKISKPAFPFRLKPSFRVVCVNRDRKVLEGIKETLGVGGIYLNNRKNPLHQTVAHYYVQSFADLLKVRDFFKDCEFQTVKGESFKNWCKCLEIMQTNRQFTKEGFLEICKLREQMNIRESKNTMWRTEEVIKVLKNPGDHIIGSKHVE